MSTAVGPDGPKTEPTLGSSPQNQAGSRPFPIYDSHYFENMVQAA